MSGGCSNRVAKVVLTDCESSNDVDDLDGTTPANMAAEKDLKIVLEQLTKAAEKKSQSGKKAPGYSGSPHEENGVRQENGGQEEDHCQVQQPCGGQESRVVKEEESCR
jgi:hypothetical protein